MYQAYFTLVNDSLTFKPFLVQYLFNKQIIYVISVQPKSGLKTEIIESEW